MTSEVDEVSDRRTVTLPLLEDSRHRLYRNQPPMSEHFLPLPE